MLILDFISLTNQEQVRLLDSLRPVRARWDIEKDHYHQTFHLDGLSVERTLKVNTWTTIDIRVQVEETPSQVN